MHEQTDRPLPKQGGDRYLADGRTAWVVRNGTKTQKRMFDTEGDCSAWVAGMNAPPPAEKVEKKTKKTKKK